MDAVSARRGPLTDELKAQLESCADPHELEDLYAPYRRRRTKATLAKERGLAPLAEFLRAQTPADAGIAATVATFVSPERGVATPELADSTRPLADAAQAMVGEWGAAVILNSVCRIKPCRVTMR